MLWYFDADYILSKVRAKVLFFNITFEDRWGLLLLYCLQKKDKAQGVEEAVTILRFFTHFVRFVSKQFII